MQIPLREMRREHARAARRSLAREVASKEQRQQEPQGRVQTDGGSNGGAVASTESSIGANTRGSTDAKDNSNAGGLPFSSLSVDEHNLRPLRLGDLQEAALTVFPTQWSAASYGDLSRDGDTFGQPQKGKFEEQWFDWGPRNFADDDDMD